MRTSIAAALAPLALLGSPLSAQQAPDLEPPIRLEAGGAPIDTGEHIAHAGPLFADYDGDGRKDLLVGNFKGHIQLYRNTGTAKAPEFEPSGLLQADGKEIRIHNW